MYVMNTLTLINNFAIALFVKCEALSPHSYFVAHTDKHFLRYFANCKLVVSPFSS